MQDLLTRLLLAGGGGFSPFALFAGGVEGAFFDVADPLTLFSDRAGTTPCGTPGGGSVVPVGLMLDKSQGLVLGANLTDPLNFTAPLWTVGANVTNITANSFETTGPATGLNSTTLLQPNKWYQITMTYTKSNTAAFSVRFDATNDVVSFTATSGTVTGIGFSSATDNIYFRAASPTTITITSISIRELPGNHAIAANDTTARPELRARVNLITNSENFAGTGWSGTATVATDVTTAPNGTTTADSVTAGSTGTFRYVRRSPSALLVNVQFTWSVFAKKNTSDWVTLRFWDIGAGVAAWFNLAAGTVGTVQSGCTASISDQGNGWYRCSITRTIGGTLSYNETDIQVSSGDNTNNATAGDSIFIWGAQLTATNEFPANTYQRIVDANTYDAVGFPRYLAFNGTSSAMSTPGNVNLSGTDKATVFTGARKTSDPASDASLIGLGPNYVSAGAFEILAPQTAGAILRSYIVGLRGSTGSGSGNARGYEGYPAPITNVISAELFAVAADSDAAQNVRINGVAVAGTSVATSSSTGVFANDRLGIGCRYVSPSLLFAGNIYSLIVVGSAVSAGNIVSTEQWVAQRTGITI